MRTFITSLMLAMVMMIGLSTTAPAAGLLTPANSNLPPLDLKDHKVDVLVEDGFVLTSVDQVFHNPHGQDMEAVYSFPVPENGTVHELTVWIDNVPVTGEVVEREQARQIYEKEKQAGRDAGLAEKNSYKTFEVSVSPVRAGQDTRVRLRYLQPASIDTSLGRYVYPLEDGGVDEQALAFWTSNETVSGTFSFRMRMRTAYPIDAVRVPDHPAAVATKGADGLWQVTINNGAAIPAATDDVPDAGEPSGLETTAPRQAYKLNKDIVVYWRLAPSVPAGIEMITHRPEGATKGIFMLTVTPGDDLAPITQGSDFVFVLDISGSMQGKYATLAEGVRQALGKLRPTDRFRIVTFNDSARELTSGWVNCNPENILTWADATARITPDRGTNLFAGLQAGIDRLDADRTSSICLVTDGVANVGETETRSFLRLFDKQDVRLFTFIMGNSANRPLLDALAKQSNGFALSVSNTDDIVGRLMQATSKVTHQALHGAVLDIDGIRTSDLTPENPGSLYRGDQLIIFGHYYGSGQATVRLKGRISGQDKQWQTVVNFPETAETHPEIERLWAYAAIADLEHQNELFGPNADRDEAIIDLAVEHGLVTDATSMLVLTEKRFKELGIDRRNQQRIATEEAARAQREQNDPQSVQADANQPMFPAQNPVPQSQATGPDQASQPQPAQPRPASRPTFSGGSGGGAFGPTHLLLLAPLSLIAIRRRK